MHCSPNNASSLVATLHAALGKLGSRSPPGPQAKGFAVHLFCVSVQHDWIGWCRLVISSTDQPSQPPTPRARPEGGRPAATPDASLDAHVSFAQFSAAGLASLEKVEALSGRELTLSALVGRDHSFREPMLPMALGGRDHSVRDISLSVEGMGFRAWGLGSTVYGPHLSVVDAGGGGTVSGRGREGLLWPRHSEARLVKEARMVLLRVEFGGQCRCTWRG